MSIECDFCSKSLSCKSNLLKHQKTAKYCLKKQDELLEKQKIEKEKYEDIESRTCIGCRHVFSTIYYRRDHIEKCTDYKLTLQKQEFDLQKQEYEKKIKETEERYIKALESITLNLAKTKSSKNTVKTNTNTTNNIINNNTVNIQAPYTTEWIESKVDLLTLTDIRNVDIFGLFIARKVMTNIYAMDRSRNRVCYIAENGKKMTNESLEELILPAVSVLIHKMKTLEEYSINLLKTRNREDAYYIHLEVKSFVYTLKKACEEKNLSKTEKKIINKLVNIISEKLDAVEKHGSENITEEDKKEERRKRCEAIELPTISLEALLTKTKMINTKRYIKIIKIDFLDWLVVKE